MKATRNLNKGGRGVFYNLLLTFGSILLFFILLECLARIVYVPTQKTIESFNIGKPPLYNSHPVLGWIPAPNARVPLNRPGSFISTIHTNSRGLRDREYGLRKNLNQKRIVVLGDSFTWGFGVDDHQIYTELLESELRNFEVINLGVSAYSTGKEFFYLKSEGMLYDPDIVLLAFSLNDIFEHGQLSMQPPFSSKGPNPKTVSNKQGEHYRSWKGFLKDQSVLISFIVDRINTNKTLVKALVKIGAKESLPGFAELDPSIVPALKNYPPTLREALENTKETLADMQEFLSKRDIRFVVALIPSRQSVEEVALRHSLSYSKFTIEDFDMSKPYKLLEEFCQKYDIEVINPLRVFKDNASKGLSLYLPRDMHFSPLGHQVFANEIFQYFSTEIR